MASIVGRLGLGALAGKIGILQLYQLSFLGLALSFVIWIIADTYYALLIAFAVVLGVAYGGIIALSPAVVAQLFGTLGMGGALGALYTANRFGGLIGPPVIGRIIDSSGHTAAQWAALASGLLGTALLHRFEASGRIQRWHVRSSRHPIDPAPDREIGSNHDANPRHTQRHRVRSHTRRRPR